MSNSIRHAFRGVALALAACIAFSPAVVVADTAPGNLSSHQVAQLRSQPLPIVVPSYVPPGFRLVHIEAWNVKQHPAPANGYDLEYKSSDGRRFVISAADSGLGDAAPDYSSYRRPFVADSRLVGSTKMSPYTMDVNGAKQWSYVSDYVPLRRLGASSSAMLTFEGNLSPDEMRRIYSSFTQISR
jgi:hypothetical protein